MAISPTAFRGNANIKRKDIQIPWSKEMLQEWHKCSEDPIYFAENYIKVVHVDRGLVPLILYPYQKRMIRAMHDGRFSAFNTARQVGKTTAVVAYILWYIIFNSDKTVAMLANKGSTAREIHSRVQLAFEHLPHWLQQGVVEWNKGSTWLENNSRIIADSTSGDAIRGFSINLLFIDEAAHIDNWDEFFTSVFPTISSGETTKVILVSTPNGLNHFYKIVINAREGRNQYKLVEVPWWEVPGRGEKWKKDTLDGLNGDTEKFAQEYECEFLGSSGTLISGKKLKELVHLSPLHEGDGFCIYEERKDDHGYVVICDVSRGKGLDYSAVQVIDVTKMPYRQVCTFRDNHITPTDYAATIYRIAGTYNNAQILVEINDIGEQVPQYIYEEYEYDNIFVTENNGRAGKTLTHGWSKKSDKGVRMTKKVKAEGCLNLKLLVEQNQLLLVDFQTISELSTFSKKGGSWEAEPGHFDDTVDGLILFAWLTTQQFFKEMTNINTIRELRDKTEQEVEDDLVPFGIVYDGRDSMEEDKVKYFSKKKSNWVWADDEQGEIWDPHWDHDRGRY